MMKSLAAEPETSSVVQAASTSSLATAIVNSAASPSSRELGSVPIAAPVAASTRIAKTPPRLTPEKSTTNSSRAGTKATTGSMGASSAVRVSCVSSCMRETRQLGASAASAARSATTLEKRTQPN
eukprot:Amastigsp_a174763_94.p4 type:complete len:125 gc:universal Amastigsp_a174763_94:696-1070(+)